MRSLLVAVAVSFAATACSSSSPSTTSNADAGTVAALADAACAWYVADANSSVDGGLGLLLGNDGHNPLTPITRQNREACVQSLLDSNDTLSQCVATAPSLADECTAALNRPDAAKCVPMACRQCGDFITAPATCAF